MRNLMLTFMPIFFAIAAYLGGIYLIENNVDNVKEAAEWGFLLFFPVEFICTALRGYVKEKEKEKSAEAERAS